MEVLNRQDAAKKNICFFTCRTILRQVKKQILAFFFVFFAPLRFIFVISADA